MKVSAILDQIDVNAIALPVFQQGYVWNGEQVRALMRSLYRRYPVGSGSTCGAEGAKAYDTAERSWRHLNFFQHECHLRAWVPRVRCPKCQAIAQVPVPWARPDSSFTLLFEALGTALAKEMPVRAIGKRFGEHDTRPWRILHTPRAPSTASMSCSWRARPWMRSAAKRCAITRCS